MSVDFNPDQKEMKYIGKFKFFCIQNFPFIADDFDQMTYYELLSKVVEYLNKVIKNTDNIIYNQEEVLKAFVLLQTYVNDYFNNLDVKDEIDNKLDEMAEDGTLTEIVSQFLNSNFVKYFSTLNDLKNSNNLFVGNVCITKGYYSENDGGSSKYIIKNRELTDVEDNGSVIFIGDNLTGVLKYNNQINIKQFGAVGDSNTDNTQKIQDAVNYSSSKKLKLIIPYGTYCVDTVNLKENTHIEGASKTESIIKRNSSFTTDDKGDNYRTGYILGYYSSVDQVIKNITLKNFTVDGIKDSLTITNETYERDATTNNIYIRLCKNVKIKNILIKNSLKSGILLKACDNVLVEDNEVCYNGSSIDGIDANGISVSGNYYSDRTLQKVEYLCDNVKILNNNCYSNTDEGIMYTNCKSLVIDGNISSQNGDRGIEGDSGSFTKNSEQLNVQITNNYIDGNTTNAITEYSSANNINYICNNNLIKNVTDIAIGIGIESDDVANISIQNNIIENCESQIFNVQGTNVNVSNNIVKNCKGTSTISGKEISEFNNNIFDNTTIYSNNVFVKSNNIINIIGNNVKNYLNCFNVQRYDSTITKIPNVNVTNNIVSNLIHLVKCLNQVQNLKISNNICDDTRESALFQTILNSNSNTIDYCNITNNDDKKGIYSLNITDITNLIRNGNTSNMYTNLPARASKPNASTNYHKKGDIAFSSTLTVGSPVGWIFDGTNWHSFGEITD